MVASSAASALPILARRCGELFVFMMRWTRMLYRLFAQSASGCMCTVSACLVTLFTACDLVRPAQGPVTWWRGSTAAGGGTVARLSSAARTPVIIPAVARRCWSLSKSGRSASLAPSPFTEVLELAIEEAPDVSAETADARVGRVAALAGTVGSSGVSIGAGDDGGLAKRISWTCRFVQVWPCCRRTERLATDTSVTCAGPYQPPWEGRMLSLQ